MPLEDASELRKRFLNDIERIKTPTVLVVAVKLPDGEIETITNYLGINKKIKYYCEAYDDEFRLKSNPSIQIMGYMIV